MKEYIQLLENRPDEAIYTDGMGIRLRLKGTHKALFDIVKYIKEREKEYKETILMEEI